MPENTKEIKVLPPYLSFKTFLSFIDRLSTSTTPSIIDRSLLHYMSGSGRSQLLSALKYLKLVDKNNIVSEDLKNLISDYNTDSWNNTLKEVIDPAYADIIAELDLKAGTDAQLQNAFKKYANVGGNTLFNSIRFFLAFLKETGTTYSPHFGVGRVAVKPKQKQPKVKKDSDEDIKDDLIVDDGAGNKRAKFVIAIPGKIPAIIYIPENIDQGDWEMVKVMLDAYVKRLTSKPKN